MKILLINKFLYHKGGDAISALNTGQLLSSKGHKVIFWGMQHPENPIYPYNDYFVPHVDFNNPGGLKNKLKIAFNIFYSMEAKNRINKVIEMEHPNIIHLHNFAHQISPSILHVFRKHNIPVLMTMHDFKLVCPVYTMLLKGRPCEKCKNGKYFQCLFNKCAKNSYTKSLLNTVEMYLHHNVLHIYDLIDTFISPSQFLKLTCEEMGLKGKIVHLPNFINAEDFVPKYDWEENSIVYFGRLSKEKGLFTLIEAAKGLNVKVKIIGEGLLKEILGSRVKALGINNVEFLGYRTGEELKNEIRKAMFVILPSEWYEVFGLVIAEAFALGKPILASKIGAIPELVRDYENGLTFEPGNVEDLRNKIEYLLCRQELISEMGKKARVFVENNFNAERHYNGLMKIYQEATDKHKK